MTQVDFAAYPIPQWNLASAPATHRDRQSYNSHADPPDAMAGGRPSVRYFPRPSSYGGLVLRPDGPSKPLSPLASQSLWAVPGMPSSTCR
jgi:hypothetical protein